MCDRLGGIAGNHFNQAYRVTDGFMVLVSPTEYPNMGREFVGVT